MSLSSPLVSIGEAAARGDSVRFWREQRYDGLECLSATFRQHRYVPHTHETYAIAGVVGGCEAFTYRGARHRVPAGSIGLVCPDEMHDGEPEGGGFVYRTLYPSVALMREIASDLIDRPFAGTPGFSDAVVADVSLNAELAALHQALAAREISQLEQDSRLVQFFGRLLQRHGALGETARDGAETGPVARVRAWLDANFAQDVGLDDLAGLAGLNRAHLVRVFRRDTGTTPHAYLVDRRFRAASRMLAAGQGAAEVALACGFCDQSHLNRVFKARMGVTPGAFRATGAVAA